MNYYERVEAQSKGLYSAAAAHFEMSISKGSGDRSYFYSNATHRLGNFYHNGVGAEKDYEIVHDGHIKSNTPAAFKSKERYNTLVIRILVHIFDYRKEVPTGRQEI
jgi:TPR repeat protein